MEDFELNPHHKKFKPNLPKMDDSQLELDPHHKKFKPKREKFDPNVQHSLKTESTLDLNSQDGIIYSMRFVFIMSMIVAVYRVMILALFTNLGDLITVVNHGTMIVVMLGIGLWCRKYGYYRDMYRSRKIDFFSEYSFMKVVSFVAGILCLVRMVSTIVYFLSMEYMNALTGVYVLAELLLWIGMATFFFCFAYNRKKRAEKLSAMYDGTKI